MKLSKRLRACASLVRRGAVLADIGCDHGYVPVSLVQEGVIPSAIAADINEGPLASCRALVAREGLEDSVRCVLSDGLERVPLSEVDDILIAGMGGELMANLLSAAGDLKDKHLILNAMTHPEHARRWLFDHGFEIRNDIIIADGRHHYSVLDAMYTGAKKETSAVDDFLGNISDFSDTAYFNHLLNYLNQKQKGGSDYAAVIAAIKEKIQ